MKNMLIFSAVVLLLFSGCVMEPDNTKQPGTDPVTPGTDPVVTPGKYGAEFRGEWIRVDNGDRWYISGSAITVNGSNSKLSVSLARTSENVVTATAGGATYTLFAARTANASFNAQVLLLDGETTSQSTARDFIGPNGRKPPIKVKNPKQPDLPPIEVTPDADTGEFEVAGVIPGDEIEIIPDDTEWEDTTVTVTPGFGEDQNMGAIPLTHGSNLKVSIRMADQTEDDITELYADETPQNYVIELENIGKTSTGDMGIERITWDDADFSLAGGTVTNLDYTNIRPGEKKEIPLSLVSKSIKAEQKIKELKIKLWNYNAVIYDISEWEDTVSLNYYNAEVPFRFRSEKQVQGVIKAKNGKSYYFKTERTGLSGNFYTEVEVPWSTEEYVIVFLGASIEAETATKYSFGVNAFPPDDWASLRQMDFLQKYKPDNENERTAPEIDLSAGDKNTFMGYLAGNSIDYYRIRLGNTPPVYDPGSSHTVDFANFGEQLAALPDTGADKPATVKLEPMTFTTSDNVSDNIIGWGAIHDTVMYAQKYIILDLSACTAEGNTVAGSYATSIPGGNYMNIIQSNQYIKGIILPATLETIGDSAFYNCDYLESVTVGNRVTVIENRAFSSSGIKSITIPDSVTAIRSSAFEYCNNLGSVIFKKSGIETSSYYPFPGNLAEVYASEGEGSYIKIAESTDWVREGGAVAALIADLAALTGTGADSPGTVKLAATNISDKWGRINNALKSAGKYVILDLSDCTAEENIIRGSSGTPGAYDMNIIKDNQYVKGIMLPSTLAAIGSYAFYNCAYLTSMTIPGSVTNIWQSALPGNLQEAYTGEGAGTYTKISGSNDWVKAGGVIDTLIKRLSALTGTGTGSPATVRLEATNISDKWGRINNAVKSAGKYVILDLSGCTAQGNTVTGKSNPGAHDMNIIKDNQYIKGVILPSTLESVGEYAFYNCANLTGITVPESVTAIGNYAFRYCTSLRSVTIPDEVTSIGNYAFADCTGLTSATIPDSVTSIGSYAFANCSALTSVTFEIGNIEIGTSSPFPGNLRAAYTAIGAGSYKRSSASNNWFASTKNDATANDIATLGLIGTSASSGNTNIATVEVIEGKIKITSVAAGSTVISVYNSLRNEAKINVTISDMGVITIGKIEKYIFSVDAFKRQLAALSGTSEAKPATVQLKAAVFSTSNPAPQDMIGWGEINTAVLSAGKYVILDLSVCTAEGNGINGNSSPSGNDMNIIKDNQYIKGFILPSALQTIGDYAFRACTYLTSITIPSGVTGIGTRAFSGCTSLIGITIPGSVTSIGNYAFEGCSGLTTVTFERVGVNCNYDPFPGNLEEVYAIEGEGTYIRNAGGEAWGKVGGAVEALIKELDTLTGTDANSPATVKLMATNISDKWGIINFTVNSAGKYIILDLTDCTAKGNTVDGYNGAWGDPSGNDMNIIGKNQYIKGVILPSTLETVGGGAFRRCTYLATITIPASVTSIGYYAFEGCTSLASITIPDSVTSIGDYAFGNCSGLITVSFEKSGVSIASNNFPGNLATVYASGEAGLYTRSAGSDSWVQKTNYFFAAFEETLAALSGTSEGNPATIKLMPTNISDKWGKFNDAVKSAEKYVILDLSACTAEGNTVTGGGGLRDPAGNDMNIINDNQYIKGVILPQNLESVGNYAFQVCSYLTSVTIPDGVTSIEGSAFYMCKSLTSITIPDSVTEIGGGAFYNCPSLITFTFEKGGVELNPKKWSYQVFDGDLSTVYEAGGAGTYTRTAGSYNWTKQ